MFTRKFLRQRWTKALRRRVLYTALTGEDRRYLWLTMKVLEMKGTDKVRNADVGRIIVKILAKLRDALKSPFIKRLELLLFGKTFLRMERRSGWSGALPIYAFRCPVHGIVENYPHGNSERLDCPICGRVIKVLGEDYEEIW